MSAPFSKRVNVLLTAKQAVTLRERACDEGRTLPNLIRRMLDQALAARARGCSVVAKSARSLAKRGEG